jgi:flotillin
MSKITGDMVNIAAQIPALFETLSGMQMSELLGRIKGIGANPAPSSPAPGTEGNDTKEALWHY